MSIRLFLTILFFSLSNASNALEPITNSSCKKDTGFYDVCMDPNKWEAYQWKACVDEDESSTLFNPSITIYEDLLIGCVGYVTKMKLIPGECKFAGLNRYCARLAEPDENGNTFGCPTCNYNQEGEEETDNNCPNCRCNCAQRICGYYDIEGNNSLPYDINEPYDGGSESDYRYCCIDPPVDSRYMPYHKETPNPCCGKHNCSIYGYDSCGNGISDGTYINAFASFIGCVDIPLGPYPPPLCDPIQGMTPSVSTFNICQYSPDYELDSTAENYDESKDFKQFSKPCPDNGNECVDTCEYSTVQGDPSEQERFSTFERPLLRLYFDNQLPLCPSGYVAPEGASNDSCIEIYADEDFTPQKVWEEKKNLIKGCDPDSDEAKPANCVYFHSNARDPIENGPTGASNVNGFDLYKYFRPYFNVSNVDSVPEDDVKHYADYSEKYPQASISFAGVYDSYYADLGHESEVEITDYTSLTRKFSATLNIEDGDGMELCAYEDVDGEIVPVNPCHPRPKMFPPKVEECVTSSSCGYEPGNTTLYTNPRILYKVGRTYTDTDGTNLTPKTGIIGINIPSSNSPPAAYCIQDDNVSSGNYNDNLPNCTVYNAKIFSAYFTDDVNYSISNDTDEDGSGTQVALGTVTPYKSGEAYTGGMQFVNYAYCRGGTKVCLSGYTDLNRKVIAYKKNDNPSNLLTDRFIPPYTEGQTKLEDSELYNPEIHDWYEKTSGAVTEIAYGYKKKVSDEVYDYYEYPDCTSGTDVGGISCTTNSGVLSYPTDEITCYCDGSKDPCYPETCTSAFEKTTSTEGETKIGYKYTGSDGKEKTCTFDECGERLLNSMELGQCVEAAQPFCGSISEDLNSPTVDENGYASWEQTNAGDNVIGTCVDGTVRSEDANGNAIDVTRTCLFVDEFNSDGTPKLESNGCPKYKVAWGEVSNPCETLPYPTWWPSQFLVGDSKLQGAIFNQFNVAYNYEDNFVPKTANYNPFDTDKIKLNHSDTWVEKWFKNVDNYNTCKYYEGARTKDETKRSSTDGDQEMLFLKRSHWEKLWNSNDLTWLLEDKEENNGCMVYEFTEDSGSNLSQINATYNKNDIVVGIKICKYYDKVSFSLVDLKKNTAKGCSNNAYIMQSNVIAYDQYVSQDGKDTRDETYNPKTAVSNNLFSKNNNTCNGYDCTQAKYRHYMYHGIVIDTKGFEENDFIKEVVKNPPPADFEQCSTPEGLKAEFMFSAQYRYAADHEYEHYTYNPDDKNSSCTGDGETKYGDIKKPTFSNETCALNPYRSKIDYSKSSISIKEYLPPPTDITPAKWNGDSVNWDDSDFDNNATYISKLYQYTCYNGDNKSNGWPLEHECRMDVKLSNYVAGNSANNPHMFVW